MWRDKGRIIIVSVCRVLYGEVVLVARPYFRLEKSGGARLRAGRQETANLPMC